tara:strand:- start:11171 stop:11566 length:396 start_codon:yes stop_codon:yes gene_type:complete
MQSKFLFRLRQFDKIVGYKKFVTSKLYFYSKDLYAFDDNEIEYDDQDFFSGYYCKNNKPIFENDILKIDSDLIILKSNKISTELSFFKLSENSISIIEENYFKNISRKLMPYSYLYLNKTLEEKIINLETQ